MTVEDPRVSVVIPTHNRRQLLARNLDALSSQSYPHERLEVLVIADGCSDGTVEMLSSYRAPYTLRAIEQANQGPAAARNRGADQSTGRFLIFLDDDLEACPSLVDSHVRSRTGPGEVLIGYLPPRVLVQSNYFSLELKTWWEAMFDAMRQTGHRFQYKDMLSGNFSVERELFHRVGGFDPEYRCHEDYELGIRLLKAGATLRFVPDAAAHHNENTDAAGSLKRKFDEGRADVRIGRDHPEMKPALPLSNAARRESISNRLMRNLAFRAPAVGDALFSMLLGCLGFIERVRVRHPWRLLLDGLLFYWYWRGAAAELGTPRSLRR
ncbi:MAG: glycosyltransferase, partial [Vicinamibacteria bacterium]